jgi:hypothetical protein
MKLYIWRNVFTDYTSGIAFAMAKSLEDARACLEKTRQSWEPIEWTRPPDEIHDEPFGDHTWGGG